LIALVAVIGLLYSTARFAGESGPYVLSRPFFLPTQVVKAAGYVYVMFSAALAQSPDRNQGKRCYRWSTAGANPTLMPARTLVFTLVYALLLLVLVPLAAFLAWSSNLVVPPALMWGLIPSLACAGLAVSIALFIAFAVQSKAEAVAGVAVVVGMLLLLQGSRQLLVSLSPDSPYQILLPLIRQGQQLLSYVSPFAASDAMLDAALRSDSPELLTLVLVTMLNIAAWHVAGTLLLVRRERLP
jgi:hypothetical protein